VPAVLLHEVDGVQLLHRPGASPFTVVSFGDEWLRADGAAYWGQALAEEQDLDVIALVSRHTLFYPDGAVAALAEAAAALGKPRRIGLGTGMGAHGVLRHGARLRLAAALAFSPVADPRAGFDPRFAEELPRGLEIPPVAADGAPPQTLLVFDPCDPVEAGHAALLAGLPRLVTAPVRHGGPDCARFATETGLLGRLLMLVVRGQAAAVPALLRRARRRSASVLATVAGALTLRRSVLRARRVVMRARRLGAGEARIHAQVAALAFRQGLVGPGIARLRLAVAAAPEALAPRLALARHLTRPALAEELEKVCREAIALDPQGATQHLLRLDALGRLGRIEELREAAAVAARALPDQRRVALRLSRALVAAGLIDEAIPALREAVTEAPQDVSAWTALLGALARGGDPESALAAAREAVIACPEDMPLRLRAAALAQSIDPALAVGAYRAALDRVPGDPAITILLADCLARCGRVAESLALLRAAIAADPARIDLRARLGAILLRGDPVGAHAVLTEALALAPDDEPLLLGLADALVRLDRVDEAVALVEARLAQHPDSAALQRRAAELDMLVDPAGAEARLRQAVADRPLDEAAHAALIEGLNRMRKGSAMVVAARRAVAALPESPTLRLLLGTALMAHNAKGAEITLREALLLAPEDDRLTLALAESLWRQERTAEGIELVRAALVLRPRSLPLRQRLLFLEREHDPTAAERLLREAAEADPGDEQARVALAEALRKQGRFEEAVAVSQALIRDVPDRFLPRLQLGHVLLAVDDLAGAEAAFRGALELFPHEGLAELGLCETHRRQKRIKEAVAAIRRAEALGVPRDSLRHQRYLLYGEVDPV
jgi:tetratricopeptide (TPR) repeat protein